jgi:prepilin-type N-terminal cleavage/methylation domain-containing protein/prepilin-type processing-associated H-X9-DG protein
MCATTNQRRAKKCGFTLIELLVVIAVIAVLLAVLLPCLRVARTVTKRAVCGSKLRQIAMAWQIYLDDHQGRFYQASNANVNYGGWVGLNKQLQPPQKDGSRLPRPLNRYCQVPGVSNEPEARLFLCPSDQGGDLDNPTEKVYRYNGTSFSTNVFLIGQNRCGAFSTRTAPLDKLISEQLPNMNIKRAANPSRLLLMGDYGWFNQWRGATLPAALKELAEWHGRRESHNMAFLDGHVRFLRIRKLVYVSDERSVLPFKDLYSLAYEVQESDE